MVNTDLMEAVRKQAEQIRFLKADPLMRVEYYLYALIEVSTRERASEWIEEEFSYLKKRIRNSGYSDLKAYGERLWSYLFDQENDTLTDARPLLQLAERTAQDLNTDKLNAVILFDELSELNIRAADQKFIMKPYRNGLSINLHVYYKNKKTHIIHIDAEAATFSIGNLGDDTIQVFGPTVVTQFCEFAVSDGRLMIRNEFAEAPILLNKMVIDKPDVYASVEDEDCIELVDGIIIRVECVSMKTAIKRKCTMCRKSFYSPKSGSQFCINCRSVMRDDLDLTVERKPKIVKHPFPNYKEQSRHITLTEFGSDDLTIFINDRT